MITLEQAYSIINSIVFKLEAEQIGLSQSIGRILSTSIIADIDQPPFNKSAMDGYACKRSDLSGLLSSIGVIAAGSDSMKPLLDGQCYRIFTGACVPEGADCVIMQEDTQVETSGKIKFLKESTKTNICYQGEDLKKGEIALSEGTCIKPQHLSIMASYGVVKPYVYKKLKVAVVCTGSELVEPNMTPAGSQIRNSNAAQLLGQLVTANVDTVYMGIVKDNSNDLNNALLPLIGNFNIILVTGGASVGDFDLVPDAFNAIGATRHFSALNIQPGKPILYATQGNTHLIGLSGNPVSSFLQYLLVVAPLVAKLSGNSVVLPRVANATIANSLTRKKGNRQLFIPVKFNSNGLAESLPFNGSAHIGALATAQGFAVMDAETTEIKEMDNVKVILF